MRWTTTYALSPRDREPDEWGVMWGGEIPTFENTTARISIPLRFDGSALRLTLSNRYGATAVRALCAGYIVRGGETAARLDFDFLVEPNSARSLERECTVRAGDELKLLVYCASAAVDRSGVFSADTAPGDRRGERDFETETSGALPLVQSVDILGDEQNFAIAALGDSITQMRLWTDEAERRTAALGRARASFLNLGIGGNRLLRDTNMPHCSTQVFGEAALRRAEFELPSLRGVKRVLVALGINDISQPTATGFGPPIGERATVGELVAGFERLERMIESAGAECVFCTITPFGGMETFDAESAAVRNEINDRIRAGGRFVDFAAAVEDAARPDFLKPEFDSGDHLHPSPAGGLAMAAAIDDELLR